MTHDKSIEIINEIIEKDDFDGDVYITDKMDKALKYAVSHLEADRWIPVSERLPEESGFYIVTIADKYTTYVNTLFFMKSMADMWEHDKRVIAWKPMPKPYESEDNK